MNTLCLEGTWRLRSSAHVESQLTLQVLRQEEMESKCGVESVEPHQSIISTGNKFPIKVIFSVTVFV